mgnify:CR=1 FL=1
MWNSKEFQTHSSLYEYYEILVVEIVVPTLTKKVFLKIPQETQKGIVFKLRDLGAGSLHGNSKGDLFIRVVVETPSRINGEQKKNISDAFSDLEKNFSESKKFIDKLNKKFKSIRKMQAVKLKWNG